MVSSNKEVLGRTQSLLCCCTDFQSYKSYHLAQKLKEGDHRLHGGLISLLSISLEKESKLIINHKAELFQGLKKLDQSSCAATGTLVRWHVMEQVTQ
jgi:hypothetical protein